MMDSSFSRERRLIFQKAVEVPSSLSERIADFMRRGGDDQELEQLVQNVRETPDRETVLDGALQKLQTLEERERQAITMNLDSLQGRIEGKLQMHERLLAKGAVRSWLDRAREALNGKERGKPMAGAPEDLMEKIQNPGQMAMDFAEGVTNTVLPTRVTENMTPVQKRVFGGALTVGTALLAGWVAYGLIRGKEAGQKQEGGFMRKAFWGFLIGGAAIIGGTYAADYLIRRFGKNLSPDAVKDAVKKEFTEMKEKVEKLEFGSKPWGEYGIEEEQYTKAKDLYSRYGKSGVADIEKIFGNGKQEECQKFLGDIEHEFDVETDEDGIKFVRPAVAMKNYEENLENGLRGMRLWIDNHKTEVILGTVVATRLGILSAALNGSLAVGKASLQMANLLRKWVQGHPLISLLLLGGTALGAFEVFRTSKKARLPENLSEFVKACTFGKSIFLMADGQKFGEDLLAALRTYGAEVAHIGDNFAKWIEENASDLLRKIAESTPEAVALTKEEVIANRHIGCVDVLRQHLEMRKSDAGGDRKQVDAGAVKNYDHALECLEEYENVFLREHCMEPAMTDETSVAFKRLHDALVALKITVEIRDGFVQWKDADMAEAWDLGVAPDVRKKEGLDAEHERSQMLYHGEGYGDYFVYALLEHLREQEQQGIDTFGDSWIGVLAGNVIYCVNPGNIKDYFLLQADAVAELFHSHETWGEKARVVTATLGKSMVTMGLFSLSADILANAKRLAIGGGHMTFNPIKLRNPGKIIFNTIKSSVPLQSQYLMGRGIYRASQDAKLFWSIRKTHGYWRARFVNTVLGKAGVRPEWIRTIENAKTVADLDLVAGYVGHGHVKEAANFEELKKSLKKYIKEEMLHKVRTRELTWKNWGKRILFGHETVSYEQVYQDVVDSYSTSAKSVRGGVPKVALGSSATEVPHTSSTVVMETAESVVDAPRALEKIEAARLAGNHEEVGRLLMEHDELLKKAAASGDKAAEQALEAARFAKGSKLAKVGSGALIGIGIAFDAYLIFENERELAQAKKENPALVATLEARRKSLVAAGGGGALLEAGMYAAEVSGGAGLVLAAPVVAGAVYSEAIYDGIREWDKSEKQYLKEDSATLLSNVREKMTSRTRASAAAHGDTMMGALWKKLTWSKEARQKYYQEKFEGTDKEINLAQRQKLYQAYAMKNSSVENVKVSAQLQSNYLSLVTDGAFIALPPEELARAEVYATLTLLRAAKEVAQEPQVISYLSPDGAKKTFDISIFQYAGVPQREEAQRIRDAVGEYRNLVQPTQLYTRSVLLQDYIKSGEDLSDDERETYRNNIRAQIRSGLVARVRHNLNKAEEYVRASGLQPYEQDVVRIELRTNLEQRMAAVIGSLESGTMTQEQFSAALQKLEYVSDEAKNSSREVFNRSTSPLKLVLVRSPKKDDATLGGPKRALEGLRRNEAKRIGVKDIHTALLDLAA